MQKDNLTVDVENILKSKAPDKYKYVPRFVISYLKRIIHQGLTHSSPTTRSEDSTAWQ